MKGAAGQRFVSLPSLRCVPIPTV